MFVPNTFCKLSRVVARDLFAKEIYSDPVTMRCSVVRLETVVQESSVRADSSASRGSATETAAMSVLLFSPHAAIATDDMVEVHGYRLRLTGIHKRVDTFGKVDHLEVSAMIEAA